MKSKAIRSKRKKKNNHTLFIVPAAVLVAVLILFAQYVSVKDDSGFRIPSSDTTVITPTDSHHSHADFKVFIDGDEFDFNRPEYDTQNRYVHIHLSNQNGDKVIHVHAREVRIGMFFQSLGMELSPDCFSVSSEESYCNEDGRQLRFFVNGEENFEFEEYVIHDLDRILVTYGDGSGIDEQIESVTDFACISSGKCPEREVEAILPEDAPSV